MDFRGAKIVSAAQFSRADLEEVIRVAVEMVPIARGEKMSKLLDGKILATLFYEPSTRTRLSFESAMLRLGGQVISDVGMQFSSLYKGETLTDTMRVMERYADVIAMRHPEKGAAKVAADALSIPFLNGGDGPGEHPTQAILDLFTIQQEKGRIDGLTIAFVGDLKYGRTVHSLIQFLLHYNVSFLFASPDELQLPEEFLEKIEIAGKQWKRVETLSEALSVADILYTTRVQKERFSNHDEYERLRLAFRIDRPTIEAAKNPKVTIMHPLPRVGEVCEEVDSMPCAAYFRQAANGVPVRMALLAKLLGKA